MKNIMEKASLIDVANIKFCIVSSSKSKGLSEGLKWITASNLLPDNVINDISKDDRYIRDDTLKVRKNDIIIKRISPSYITYIDEELQNVYAYNNLILVRAKNAVNPKYLATILNQKIREISISASVGAVVPSIGRPELEKIEIPLLPLNEQKAIGEIWITSINKKKMAIRLAELENIKENYMINNFFISKTGGKI